MTLRLYNTLTRRVEDFVPGDPNRVTMYVCGPTVYNYAHIGNARPVVVFDVLFRLLRRLYGDAAVIYARNVTDVDDKINAKAAAEGAPISTITDRFLAAYHEDMDALGALRPTLEPRATAYIGQMSALIERLVERGAAYESAGEVLFDVPAYAASGGDYGKLSGRSLDDMVAGARVEVADNKRNPADFVLWKPSKPGEPEWEGPLGLKGRPGWHIECSAMSEDTLGLPFDIHGGGHDLIFPHHTNEIAQSCAAHGAADPAAYARYWMHNGFLDMAGEKMSKSLGNVVIPHELLRTTPGEVIRWALLTAHYRSPLDWTPSLLEHSRKAMDSLYQTLRDAKKFPTRADLPLAGSHIQEFAKDSLRAIEAALLDDLHTPRAQAALFGLMGLLRADIGLGKQPEIIMLREKLLEGGRMLGLLQEDPDTWFTAGVDDDLKAKVDALIADRVAARAAKDWAAADRIRAELTALNVEVMDNATGATWRIKEPA